MLSPSFAMPLPRSIRVLVAPRAVFEEAATLGKGFETILLLLFIELLLAYPGRAATSLVTMTFEPVGGLLSLYGAFVSFALKPALLVFAAGVVLYYALRSTPTKVPLWGAASVATYAYTPHVLLVAASLILAAMGLDARWMPHQPLAGMQGPGVVLKLAIEVAPSLAFGAIAVRTLRARGATSLPVERSGGGPRAWAVVAGVALLMGAAAWINVERVRDDWARLRPVMPEDRVPRFAVRALDGGGVFRDADLIGKVTLIDFWATWCPPCVAAMPHLAELHRRFEPRGVSTLSVNIEGEGVRASASVDNGVNANVSADNRVNARDGFNAGGGADTSAGADTGDEQDIADVVRSFAKEHRLPFPVYLDDGTMRARFKVSTFPTIVIVDRQGRVRHIHVGATSSSTLERELEGLLVEGEERAAVP